MKAAGAANELPLGRFDADGALTFEGNPDVGATPDGIYDGEVVALDRKGAPDFGALQTALAGGKTDGLIYFVFDLLFAEGEDLQHLPLRERKASLERIVKKLDDDSLIRYVEHFDASDESVLETARQMSLEDAEGTHGRQNPFVGQNAPRRQTGVHWLKPEIVAQIEFAGWTGDGMVRAGALTCYPSPS